jgi:hypothetical protein
MPNQDAARNSLAHKMLDRILAGEIDHGDGVVPCGYNMQDGSAVEYRQGLGWVISACLPTCKCLLGRNRAARAKKTALG